MFDIRDDEIWFFSAEMVNWRTKEGGGRDVDLYLAPISSNYLTDFGGFGGLGG